MSAFLRPAWFVALFAIAAAPVAVAQAPPAAVSRPVGVEQARKVLGLTPLYDHVRTERVKVAVLDFGFEGVGDGKPYLPADAVVVEHYDADFIRRFNLGDPDFRKGFEPGNAHGRQMAQLVWAVTGNRPEGPKFYLLNANGPTLFRRAVRYAVEQRVDLILFSGVFEGGGNFDGRGPINRAVDEAVDAGIVWVNAAGNFGRQVYNGPARATVLHLRNRLDENAVTVTLTWNDYRDAEDAGTDKDLDLTVEDANGRVLARGDNVQVAGAAPAGPGQSRNPRERVTALLPADGGRPYQLRIAIKGGRFGPPDRLRVLVTAAKPLAADPRTGKPVPAVELVEASGSGEIYPPADHPGVITVGDAGPSSSVGPTADGRRKPDILIDDAQARFSGGETTAGASNAAAYFAGTVAVLKALRPELRAEHLLRHAAALEHRAAVEAALRVPAVRLAPPGQEPIAVVAPPPPDVHRAWESPDGRIVVYSARPPSEWGPRVWNHLDERSARALASYPWQPMRPTAAPAPVPTLPPPPPGDPRLLPPPRAAAPRVPPGPRMPAGVGPRWRVPDPAELRALLRPAG